MYFRLEAPNGTMKFGCPMMARKQHIKFGGNMFLTDGEDVVAITADPDDEVRWNRQVRGGVKTLKP